MEIKNFFTDKPVSLENLKVGVGKGWHKLIDDLVKDLWELGWDGGICQVKEKFGGLRFYIESGSKKVFDRIQIAEDLSFLTCEGCGTMKDVETTADDGYWIKTLCSSCRGKKE